MVSRGTFRNYMQQDRNHRKYSRLTDNVSSDFLHAVSAMTRKDIMLVYVEGYDDVSFWRGLLSEFESEKRHFEISPPARGDLAKGKKVVLNFVPKAGKHLLLCVDSDFDYLFGDLNDQSRLVNGNPYVMQTYTYSAENLLCYPPSLHSVAARAVKNDAYIFDFEEFMSEYSRIIYPLFLWYLYAARINRPSVFPLADFRNAVRLNYLNVENNGEATLDWLQRHVEKKERSLTSKHPEWKEKIGKMEADLQKLKVAPEETHLYMQGHTLMDNVVKVMLEDVCEALRKQAISKIMGSSREGMSLHNELSHYNNSLQDMGVILESNTLYRSCPLYLKLRDDIVRALQIGREDISG